MKNVKQKESTGSKSYPDRPLFEPCSDRCVEYFPWFFPDGILRTEHLSRLDSFSRFVSFHFDFVFEFNLILNAAYGRLNPKLFIFSHEFLTVPLTDAFMSFWASVLREFDTNVTHTDTEENRNSNDFFQLSIKKESRSVEVEDIYPFPKTQSSAEGVLQHLIPQIFLKSNILKPSIFTVFVRPKKSDSKLGTVFKTYRMKTEETVRNFVNMSREKRII